MVLGTILLAIALMAGGFAAGWFVRDRRTERPQATAATAAPAANWSFQPLSAEDVCGRKGDQIVRRALRPTHEGRMPKRLSDHMPRVSPFAIFESSNEGPFTDLLRPWHAPMAAHRLQRAYVRGFNSTERAGGFSVFAYQFPSETEAVGAAAETFGVFVCDYGGEPFTVPEQAGIVVGVRPDDTTTAFWVHGKRVVEVNWSWFGDLGADQNAAATVIEAAWEAPTQVSS
jgi:hypothetical protein